MKRLITRLCLPLACVAGLAACSSTSLHDERAGQRPTLSVRRGVM